MKTYDRDYDIRHDYPEFEVIQEHGFCALAETLDDGRYIVVTNTGAMDFPTYTDFMVCVYRDEKSFNEDPTTSLLASATSDNFSDIDHALNQVTYV